MLQNYFFRVQQPQVDLKLARFGLESFVRDYISNFPETHPKIPVFEPISYFLCGKCTPPFLRGSYGISDFFDTNLYVDPI